MLCLRGVNVYSTASLLDSYAGLAVTNEQPRVLGFSFQDLAHSFHPCESLGRICTLEKFVVASVPAKIAVPYR